MKNIKRIWVCPLDWGLGHAGRCIPVIRQLLKDNHEVTIGANGNSLLFLQREFPNLPFVRLPGYTISYSKHRRQMIKLILQIPKILLSIRQEHRFLQKTLIHEPIDVIISDNRYGLWNKNVYSVLLTHQLMLKLPGRLKVFEGRVHRWLRKKIEKFDECWIPDVEGTPNLTGDLGHKYKIKNVRFTGPLSRFATDHSLSCPEEEFKNDLLVILSGPEPQRTLLEDILIKQLSCSHLKTIIVRGKPDMHAEEKIGNIRLIPFLTGDLLLREILRSKSIIARAGYTTIMELASLNKFALLVPTPGQNEQEYLAGHLKKLGIFEFMAQDGLTVSDYTVLMKGHNRLYPWNHKQEYLEQRIDEISVIV